MRFLIAESEPRAARAERRASVGRSSGESYAATLDQLVPGVRCERIKPADEGERLLPPDEIRAFDAVFLTGSPMHLYERNPEVERELAFMDAVFASGTPAFGSCAGLQVAAVAAGGTVRPMQGRREAGIGRRIMPTAAGRDHPLLAGRPAVFDAPSIHGDEVEHLPEGALLLASSRVTRVQAAEIRHRGGIFWGVQYHPELSPGEIAAALRRQADDFIQAKLVADAGQVEASAALLDAIDRDPGAPGPAWQLGLDDQMTEAHLRRTELRNFIEALVRPVHADRGRDRRAA